MILYLQECLKKIQRVRDGERRIEGARRGEWECRRKGRRREGDRRDKELMWGGDWEERVSRRG